MNIAIIPAGGQGRRLGGTHTSARPKQFLLLGGFPIIVHTLLQFETCPDIDAVIVVLPEAEVRAGSLEDLIAENRFRKVLPAVVGADERQGSVYCGLRAIADSPSLHSETKVVAIHDAVRPFITPALISETIRAALEHDGAICALPVVDTIKEVEHGRIVRTLPRARMYQAQTPQAFKYPVILDAHRKAAAEGMGATDDAMLIEWLGGIVAIVEGLPENIKITKPTDLILAEQILKNREIEQ